MKTPISSPRRSSNGLVIIGTGFIIEAAEVDLQAPRRHQIIVPGDRERAAQAPLEVIPPLPSAHRGGSRSYRRRRLDTTPPLGVGSRPSGGNGSSHEGYPHRLQESQADRESRYGSSGSGQSQEQSPAEHQARPPDRGHRSLTRVVPPSRLRGRFQTRAPTGLLSCCARPETSSGCRRGAFKDKPGFIGLNQHAHVQARRIPGRSR